MRHPFLIALISVSLLAANVRPCPARQASAAAPAQGAPALDQHAQKMKRNVEKLGVGHQVTAVLKDGKEYHGAVSKIEAESFQVAEVDLKQVVTINYDETKKLYRDYFHKDPFFGRNPRRNTIIFVSAMAFLTTALIAGLTHISN